MKEKIISTWNYDKALNFEREKLERIISHSEEISRLETKIRSDLTLIKKHKISVPAYNSVSIANYESMLNESKKANAALRSEKTKDIQELERSKPFIVGPATIDSLINQVPNTYDYIDKGELPFNSIFFEFSEGIQMKIPFLKSLQKVNGITLYRTADSPDNNYCMIIYSNDKTDNNMNRVELTFNLRLQGRISGSVNGYLGSSNGTSFIIDMNSKIVEYVDRDDYQKRRYSGDPNYQQDLTKDQLPLVSSELDKLENREFYTQIANLCTNLVNYINAHNVQFVKKERTVDVLTRNERGKKKKEQRAQDFYIVQVKDEVHDESEPTGKTWELKERIYVRGHDRRYRGESGRIRMTTWISPYIKGPPDAPWREQRYQVLADKLLKEQQLIEKYN